MNYILLVGIVRWSLSTALGAEALAATLHTDPKTGEILLFGCWLNEARVYRITG